MKERFALAFPYLCALLVVGVIVWDHFGSDVASEEGLLDVAQMPAASTGAHVDPVCRMEVGQQIELRAAGRSFYFCAEYCREKFRESPREYLREACLVCRSEGLESAVAAGRFEAVWQGKTYGFCSAEHREAFGSDPAGYFLHTMWGIPNWLYYSSIAFVLLVSFGVIEWSAKTRFGAAAAHRPYAARMDPPLASSPGDALRGAGGCGGALCVGARRGTLRESVAGQEHRTFAHVDGVVGRLDLAGALHGQGLVLCLPLGRAVGLGGGFALLGARRRRALGLKLKWPRFMANIWPATLLFVGLTWIELGFGVTMKPRATAWLGLGMLGLCFVSLFLFDRKSFCRYGCLVGRISGLYALFSPIEIRSKDRDRCRSCSTHSCFKGNDAGEACPTFQSLRVMDQSTYCILCAECLKTCEQGNVALRLRPWGEDLVTGFRPRSDEAYLALIMLSLTGFHGLTMTGAWGEVIAAIESALGVGPTLAFSLGMAGLMVAPPLLYAALVALSRWMARGASIGYRDYFIRYAYALLPIALFYHIAHNSEHLLMEGQKVVALLSDPFGFEWDLFGTASWRLAPLVSLPTLWLIQVFFVMLGHVYSLWVARRVAGGLFPDSRVAFRSQAPMLAAMILFSVMSLWLLKQPMEMRTSAM